MKPSRKAILVLGAITILFIAATSVSAQTSERKAGNLALKPYLFESDDGHRIEAEMGKLSVPENRSNPRSRLIELSFVRFKSTSTAPGSPIVYLAGGPGGSGFYTARGSRFPLFMALREVADVIAFDQRGTGLSTPALMCREPLGYPLDKPGDPDELLKLFKERSTECIEYFKAQGVDLAGYNTNENADDLEDLRKALGARKLSLWSISYGTHLALAAIKRHESSIDRVILAGVEGPAHTIKLPSNIQQNLVKISDAVKNDPALNRSIPDLIELMKTVWAKLEKEPLKLDARDPQTGQSHTVTLGKFDLQWITASAVGNSEISMMPAVYYAISKGNTAAPVVRLIAQRAYSIRRGPIGSAMTFAMDCASGISTTRRTQVAREAREAVLGDSIDFPFPQVCEVWGNDLGDGFRSEVKTKVPALFISGTFDARTPVSNAEEVRRGFSTSHHLVIERAVHSDPLFLSSPKIKEAMLEFMRGKSVATDRIQLPPFRFAPMPEGSGQ